MELDYIWTNFWFQDLLLTVPHDKGLPARDLIATHTARFPELKKLSYNSKYHRTFPRLQWLIDLGLVRLDSTPLKRLFTRTECGDKLLFNLQKLNTEQLHNPYKIIKSTYEFGSKLISREIIFEEKLKEFHTKGLSILKIPSRFMRVSTLKYLMCTYYCTNGMDLDYQRFERYLLKMFEMGEIELASSPNPQYNDDVQYMDSTFHLVALS